MKKVIDGDTFTLLERFEPAQTEKMLKKYRRNKKYQDVTVDGSGDIILHREL